MADPIQTAPAQPTPSAQPSDTPKPDAPASVPVPAGGQPARDDGPTVPSYRLRETREQLTTQFEARIAELQAQLDERDRRVRTALGVDTPDPRAEAIRKEFLQYFPEYERLQQFADPKKLERLERLLDSEPATAQMQERFETNVGHSLLDSLDTLMADAYGDKVTPFAKQAAYAAFTAWVASDEQASQHYQWCLKTGRSDPSLTAEFWKQYSSGVLESHRQHFSAAESQRRAAAARFPRGGPGSDVIPGGKKKREPFKTLDEAMEAADQELRAQREGTPRL